jgi:hypothetical protein
MRSSVALGHGSGSRRSKSSPPRSWIQRAKRSPGDDRLRERVYVALPERARELLEELSEVQARPVSDPALVERMRTKATTWINAVHMQYWRVSDTSVDWDLPGGKGWRQGIDLHFLVVALTRLRRAVGLATRVKGLQDQLIDHLVDFDQDVPALTLLRNVAEHFDDYTTGKGRNAQARRHQLQVWSLGDDGKRGLVWRWLGVELPVEAAHAAATSLYRDFLADVELYVATRE